MTKRDFEAIAQILRDSREAYFVSPEAMEIANGQTDRIASGLADYFAAQNPRFNVAKFFEACD